MLIDLYTEPHPKSSIFVRGLNERLQLPARNLLVLDTSILFPTIFPLDKVKVYQILEYSSKIHKEFEPYSYVRRKNRLECERQLRISKAVEKNMLQKIGYQPAITLACCTELSILSENTGGNFFSLWRRNVSSFTYEIRLDIGRFRKIYQELSNSLKDDADFSIAAAVCSLGSDYVSDDHNSFNVETDKIINDICYKRWGRIPKRYDSESLCKLLLKN
jgi:hypothetical protein